MLKQQKLRLDYIRKRRIEAGLSLQYVGKQLGFKNASTYFKYETGKYAFKAEMLPTLAKVLNCKIEDFFAHPNANIATEMDGYGVNCCDSNHQDHYQP